MIEYIFYRLPHHVTPGYVNSKGEQQVGVIGCTKQDFDLRMQQRSREGFDITDAYVLETSMHATLKSAWARETELQLQWDCLDHAKQPAVKTKKSNTLWSIAVKDYKKIEKKKQPKKSKPTTKSKCPYCEKYVIALESHMNYCHCNPIYRTNTGQISSVMNSK
jgi:hypothetical protein